MASDTLSPSGHSYGERDRPPIGLFSGRGLAPPVRLAISEGLQCATRVARKAPQLPRYLGVSERTLYLLVNGGKVAAYRFGRVLRYKRADLDRFIEGSVCGSLISITSSHPRPTTVSTEATESTAATSLPLGLSLRRPRGRDGFP